MITDVLADALEAIEEYERRFPAVYGPYARSIARVKREMRDTFLLLAMGAQELGADEGNGEERGKVDGD